MLSDKQFEEIKAKIDQEDIPADQVEVEFKFYQQPNDRNFRESVFHHVRETLWNDESYFVDSQDDSYDDNIRKTVINEVSGAAVNTSIGTDNESFMRKTNLGRYHPQLDNTYITLSREVPLTSIGTAQPTGTYRHKRRWSIPRPFFRLDLTEVRTNTKAGSNEIYYEIEAELPDMDFVGRHIIDINTDLTYILKIIHSTNFVYPLSLKASVFSLFNSKFNERITPNSFLDNRNLTQAVDLTQGDLANGYLLDGPEDKSIVGKYGVALKADGVRRFLIVYRGDVFLIGNPYEMNYLYRLKKFQEDAVIIIEGELVTERIGNDVPLFLGYDILWLDKQDISTYPYYMRVDELKTAIQMFSNTRDIIDCRYKEFYPFRTTSEFFRLNNQLLNLDDGSIDYKIDGLMYTPAQASYRATVVDPTLKIFKWKPPSMLTIDFVAKDGIVYAGSGKRLVKFDRQPNYAPLPKDSGYKEGMVAEFKLIRNNNTNDDGEDDDDPQNGTWHFVRLRPDKRVPNSIQTANHVFNRIRNPINVESIRGNRFMTVMRLMNDVKREMYRFIPANSHVISIGAGRGGDLLKWDAANVSFVDAIEPDDTNANEFERRYIQRPYKFGYKMHRMPAQEVTAFDIEGSKMVVMEFMLSMSFFTPEEVIKLTSVLMKGDLLLIYTINGDKVRKHFDNPDNYEILKSGNYRSKINQIIFVYSPASDKIYVKIPNSIVTGQQENLVPVKELNDKLRRSGFRMTREVSLRRRPMINSQELRWFDLFDAMIYTKQ